jgi:peptide/nickel transport system permease protein
VIRHWPTNRLLGLALFGSVAVFGFAGFVWTPFDPYALDFLARLEPASTLHWFGTDEFGRDVLSRLLVATGVSLMVAAGVVAGALSLGVMLGAMAAHFRGWCDRLVVMFSDALMAFPGLLLALGLMAAIGPNRWGVVAALSLAYTPKVIRVTRATALSVSARDYVLASRALGNGELLTVVRHVIPNCVSPLTIVATTLFGNALLSETALSFLGLGVPPPASSLGGMMADGRQYLSEAPRLIVLPGLVVSLTLLGINLLGDALRDRLDPRMAGP